jgi:hypothetical protein
MLTGSIYSIFWERIKHMPGMGREVFQQLFGINVGFNYTPIIFESIDASKDDQLLQSVNLLFTIFATSLVDKLERKTLMIFGAGSLAIFYYHNY